MQLFTNSKRQVVSTIYLILYPLLVGMDLLTTYLASPDLKFEANPVIRYFQFGWTDILSWAISITLLSILLVLRSNKYILKFFENKTQNKPVNKFFFFLSCFIVICFCGIFIIEIFLPINNYFSYLYLFPDPENIFQKIAIHYVNFCIKYNNIFGLFAFAYVCIVFFFLLGALIAIYQINRVKKYVQSTLSP
jgi:hypothetical protein